MKNGMKPCPFCGNEDIGIHSFRFYKDVMMLNTYHYKADVICVNCNTIKVCSVIGENEEDCKNKVAEEWNKRANEISEDLPLCENMKSLEDCNICSNKECQNSTKSKL